MDQHRQKLHDILVAITPNVYFQPPENLKLQYPCIIYQRNFAQAIFANNSMYHGTKRYEVTIIDSNPDSDIPSKVESLPMCTFQRFFVADNLNHDVYNLFF